MLTDLLKVSPKKNRRRGTLKQDKINILPTSRRTELFASYDPISAEAFCVYACVRVCMCVYECVSRV